MFFGLGGRRKPSPAEMSSGLKAAIEKLVAATQIPEEGARKGGASVTKTDKEKAQVQKLHDEVVEKMNACIALLPSPPLPSADQPSSESPDAVATSAPTASSSPPSVNPERDELCRHLLADGVLQLLPDSLRHFDFEGRRLGALLFCNAFSAYDSEGNRRPAVDYCASHPSVMQSLIKAYNKGKVVPRIGGMLRCCVLHEPLVHQMLDDGHVYALIELAKEHNFDVASDAFVTLRELLLGGFKPIAAAFLDESFEPFFAAYWTILNTDSYVTVRQSLKLLSEMLLDRQFIKPMLKYVKREKFLMLHMEQLRNESKAIAFESFHLFKIFVANPFKPYRVHKILYSNKDKIIKFLQEFLKERDEMQFQNDKHTVLEKLENLKEPPPPEKQTQEEDAKGGGEVKTQPPPAQAKGDTLHPEDSKEGDEETKKS